MENYMEEKQEIRIDESSRYNMLEAARWGKFLAIVGFVSTGLMLVAGLFMGSFMASMSAASGAAAPMPPFFFGFLYLVIALTYIYPVYALYKFSTISKRALHTYDQQLFNTATGYLKSMFKYLGIFIIVVICLYVVIILFAITVGITSGLSS